MPASKHTGKKLNFTELKKRDLVTLRYNFSLLRLATSGKFNKKPSAAWISTHTAHGNTTGAAFSVSHLALPIKLLTDISLGLVNHYQESYLSVHKQHAQTHTHVHNDADHSTTCKGTRTLQTPQRSTPGRTTNIADDARRRKRLNSGPPHRSIIYKERQEL